MLAATQAIEEKRRSKNSTNNQPADHAILEEVHLKNFMCHEDMTYQLGPLINFICGKNGSGKSAILTAIVLCLGGKASATNRGARLQSFIREGTDHASIVCKIKNQGENAYMPEVYGKTIQVERHFSRTGGSGFKLKSEKGRVISTRKSDLDEICDHMILQIDNPMAVLSQDQARQFIASSSQTEKYKFFMKGVQLEQLDQDYRIIEEQLDNIGAKIAAKVPDLEVLKRKDESARNKQELSRKYDNMLDKIRDYRRQLAWTQVAAQEDIRNEYAKEIADADAKIAEAEGRVEQIDAVFQESDRAASVATEAYNDANAIVRGVEVERENVKLKYDKIKKDTQEAQAEQRSIRGALMGADNTIKAKKEAILQEEQRLAELDGGGAARRINDLHNAKEAWERAKEDAQRHREQREDRLNDIERVQQLEKELDEARLFQSQRVKQQEANLKQLVQNRNSLDQAFHPNIRALSQALRQEKGFQNPPVGPLGKHVRLLKPEWSSILEKSFGSALNSFIVSSKRDEILLSDIMRRTKCSLPIFIVNNQPIDIQSHLPDSRFDTVLSVLDIDNEAVKKQLVIGNAIEQSILIPDMSEASKALYSEGRPLRNVKRCFCFSPGSKMRGAVLSYRNGQAAQDPVHEFQGSPRMRTDIDDSIRRQQDALEECKAQLLRAEEEFRNARERHQKAKQALQRHDRADRDHVVAEQRAHDEVERLEEEIKEDSIESGKLEVLRQSLIEAEEQKVVHEGSYQDSVLAFDQLKEKLREDHQALAALDDRISEAQAAATRAQAIAQKAGKKRAHDLGEKNAAIARIDDARADRGTMERKLAEMDAKIADFIEQARAVSERVNIAAGETHDSLKKKYERLRADYQKYHNEIGDREHINNEAAKWSKMFKTAQEEIAGLEALRDQLASTMQQRRVRWKLFRSHISHRARANFNYMLSERGFRGALRIDHTQKMMNISVEPDITRRDGTGRSARTLSGGEKSFAQICLLLSIWDAMGVPIRCLDEFDVFMDAVNRTTSVNLLIEGARQSIGSQFILISPGTKSDIKRAPDVCAIE